MLLLPVSTMFNIKIEKMEKEFYFQPVGKIIIEKEMFIIELHEEYWSALTNIDGFSHLQIVWWGNLYDSPESRKMLVSDKPYKKGPEKLGIFATRSPVRPNPVLITNIEVAKIDMANGRISTYYIDAEPGTPVLDIKPYHLSERVKGCTVPGWCKHWPKWDEETADFDWANEFNF